jgi:hypothetical protein
MDDDLKSMSREQLEQEVRRLRAGIRTHRDSSGHELCWHHPELWSLLPERLDPAIAVPPWPKFLRGCIQYRQSLDEQRPDATVHDAEFGLPGSVVPMRLPKNRPETKSRACIARARQLNPDRGKGTYTQWAR